MSLAELTPLTNALRKKRKRKMRKKKMRKKKKRKAFGGCK